MKYHANKRYRNNMPLNDTDQVKQEQLSWLKTLEVLRQENVLLKNKLAGTIKGNVGSAFLEKAEYFYNLFLDKDTVISLLRMDIAQLTLKTGVSPIEDVMEVQLKLRSDVARMEQEFKSVKSAFNIFLAGERDT